MKLTEQEQAELTQDIDAVSYLIARHDSHVRSLADSPEQRAYHATRAAYWRIARDELRARNSK